LSTPAVIAIASASLFVVIFLVFLLCILSARRQQKRNKYMDRLPGMHHILN
jgi:cbb3-type cytochrome oxidase subunit 3